VRDGFCKLDQELTKPRIKTKTIRYVRIVEGVSLARRAALLRRAERQKQFYDLLQELGGEAAYAVLREKIDKADLALRALLKKGLIDLEEREEITDPFFAPLRSNTESAICELTPAQQLALDAILPGLHQRIFQPFLLHGVTGSGKTEIYLRIIQQTLQLGRQAIVLVPEIALTPQLVGVFRQRLGDQLAVLHSGLSERERFEHWWHIRRGDVPLVIGARSAIFAPFSDLGVIIVDEEQESSYKQEGRFPYHARNLALVRGKDNQATVVLGSATPAFESFNNAHNGKWKYLALPERIHAKPLPGIEIIDLRQIGQRVGGILSPQLKDHIEQNLKSGDQTILFLNRRGYHTSLLCTACGYAFRCLYCSVGLTFHQQQNALLCHYCGYAERLPQCCPQCQCPEIEYLGRGTEKIHEILHQIFPHARIDRMDRDTISGQRGQLEHLLQRFNRHEIDILLGTQMVAKGHDFPGVTLVGVLLADMGMNLPDFRSAERTFQLLVQVAGRAGRGQRPGRVVIQTFNPSHPSIQFVQQHDYIGFYESEITSRYDLGYPPFGWLIALRFDGRDPDIVRSVAEEIGQMAAALISQPPYSSVVFLGPAPAPIERIKSRFRWQMLFKSAHRTVLHAMIWQLMRTENLLQSRNQVKISIDPDPINML
jgi:primosomal protein N' (replication factor Y)